MQRDGKTLPALHIAELLDSQVARESGSQIAARSRPDEAGSS
jgi:hypothetical protein